MSGQVDYEREQQREQDVGFTEAAREGRTAEYCGKRGVACGKSRRLWEGLPSLPEGKQVPGWKKAGNLVPYLAVKRAGPALRKACV